MTFRQHLRALWRFYSGWYGRLFTRGPAAAMEFMREFDEGTP